MEGIEDVSKDCGAPSGHHSEPFIERQDRDSLVPALPLEFRKNTSLAVLDQTIGDKAYEG